MLVKLKISLHFLPNGTLPSDETLEELVELVDVALIRSEESGESVGTRLDGVVGSKVGDASSAVGGLVASFFLAHLNCPEESL